MSFIDFGGQRSKVKVTIDKSGINLENIIEAQFESQFVVASFFISLLHVRTYLTGADCCSVCPGGTVRVAVRGGGIPDVRRREE